LQKTITIGCLEWEDHVINEINRRDQESGEVIAQFYQHCLDFNQLAEDA